jgi:hypothetical protein
MVIKHKPLLVASLDTKYGAQDVENNEVPISVFFCATYYIPAALSPQAMKYLLGDKNLCAMWLKWQLKKVTGS